MSSWSELILTQTSQTYCNIAHHAYTMSSPYLVKLGVFEITVNQ